MIKTAIFKRLQTPALVIAALATGLLAVTGMRGYINAQLAARAPVPEPPAQWADVLVAKNDWPAGETVGQKTVALRRFPRAYLPARAVAADAFETLIGRRFASEIKAGEPVTEAVLEPVQASVFSNQLPPGARALSIAVDEVNSISGMLRPGDRIDLQLSVKPASFANLHSSAALTSTNAAEITTHLLADIQVLATGGQIRMRGAEASNKSFSSITVQVTPEQAQRLIVAQRSGRLTAMLRPREESGPPPTKPLDLAGLLQLPRPALPVAARPEPEIIMGGRGPVGVSNGGQHVPNR